MGTALTEQQLRELARLARGCCSASTRDAAGEAATLRGMELAAAQGFDVRVVALPPGSTRPTRPTGFEDRLGAAEPTCLPRAARGRAGGRPARGVLRIRELLAGVEDSPERQEAVRFLARPCSTCRVSSRPVCAPRRGRPRASCREGARGGRPAGADVPRGRGAHAGAAPGLASSATSTSTPRSTGASAHTSPARPGRRRRRQPSTRSSGRRPRRGCDRRPGAGGSRSS